MRKKLICLILGIIMCCGCFAGCTLIEHNDEKDARQVIAVINSVEDTTNGITYKSSARYIYKSDLIRSMNSYAQQYMQNYNMDLQTATETLLNELITRELLLIEIERLETQELIEITQKDRNEMMRTVYSAIDSQLDSLRSEIMSDYNESVSGSDSSEESASTTYPVPETPDEEEDYSDYEFDENGKIVMQTISQQAVDIYGQPMFEKKEVNGEKLDDETKPITVKVEVPKYKVWQPEASSYPAMSGTEDEKSLDREAMRRFITLIKEIADSDFKATKQDKAKFKQAADEIDRIINTQGIEAVYPKLYRNTGDEAEDAKNSNYLIEYVLGTSAEQSVLITKLRDFITDGVKVTDEEIVDAYTTQLSAQKEEYTNNPQAYQTAVSEGSVNVLYSRDDSYFFVKHILLPFSAEQTAALTAYKNDPVNAGKDYTDYRDNQMVNETVVYPHVNGENDLTNPKTVQEVYNEIYSAMIRLKANPREAERKFDEFTYKYNTDNGAFGYGKSYAVKRGDDEGHSGYMEEFYDGAMKLYNGYVSGERVVGEMLPELVVTDYGVHLMYLSRVVVPDSVLGLNDYLTHGEYQTVRETFESTIRTNKENKAFTSWQTERITYYREKPDVVKTYTKRYKSLYETK